MAGAFDSGAFDRGAFDTGAVTPVVRRGGAGRVITPQPRRELFPVRSKGAQLVLHARIRSVGRALPWDDEDELLELGLL